MYDDFTLTDRWTGQPVHCFYRALIMAISTRHADAVDVKFLVNGRTVWVSLPCPAWVEYNKRTGNVMTDPMAVQVAGRYLKQAIENGEDGGREMLVLTLDETMRQIEGLQQEFGDGASGRK